MSIKFEGMIQMLDNISLVLVIIGAINWGSIGFFGYDIVGSLFGGQGSVIARIIFAIVGIAGLWAIGMLFKDKISTHESWKQKRFCPKRQNRQRVDKPVGTLAGFEKRKVNLPNMDSSAYVYTVEFMFGESKQNTLKSRWFQGVSNAVILFCQELSYNNTIEFLLKNVFMVYLLAVDRLFRQSVVLSEQTEPFCFYTQI